MGTGAGAEGTYITDAMRSAVGRVHEEITSFPVDPSDIRRWAIAVHHPEEPPRIHWDEAYARTTSFGGIVAPEDFNPFAWMVADPPGLDTPLSEGSLDDAIEGKAGVAGPGLVRALNGGVVVTYGPARIRPGDVIRSASTITGYTERDGRHGRMLFTTTDVRWVNQRDEHVKTSTLTLIRY